MIWKCLCPFYGSNSILMIDRVNWKLSKEPYAREKSKHVSEDHENDFFHLMRRLNTIEYYNWKLYGKKYSPNAWTCSTAKRITINACILFRHIFKMCLCVFFSYILNYILDCFLLKRYFFYSTVTNCLLSIFTLHTKKNWKGGENNRFSVLFSTSFYTIFIFLAHLHVNTCARHSQKKILKKKKYDPARVSHRSASNLCKKKINEIE